MRIRGYFSAPASNAAEPFDINNPIPEGGLSIYYNAHDVGYDVAECEFSANKIFDLTFDPFRCD